MEHNQTKYQLDMYKQNESRLKLENENLEKKANFFK
jgi:hypothetical protein